MGDIKSAKTIPQWVKDLKPSGPQGSELLEQERNKSNVDVNNLADFLFTKEGRARKQRVLKTLQSDKVFDKSQNYFAGRVGTISAIRLTFEHKAKTSIAASLTLNWREC